MSVSLLTVWRAARARAVPFSGESAGYLVLLACEELMLAPRAIELQSIALEPDGKVRLTATLAAAEIDAERQLRAILGQLLEVASSPGLALLRGASRPALGRLRLLSSELESALIPANRAAARRALSRLHRETERACETGKLAEMPRPLEVVSSPCDTAPAGATQAGDPSMEVGAPDAARAMNPRESVEEHPTRPESLVARRLAPPPTIAERQGIPGTQGVPEMSEVEGEDAPSLQGEAAEQLELDFGGSSAAVRLPDVDLRPTIPAPPDFMIGEQLAHRETPVLDVAARERAELEMSNPLSFDFESWPIELAQQTGEPVLGLEWGVAADALEPELGGALESPLGLSSLPHAVRPVPSPTPRPMETSPAPAEPYPGLPSQRSDVRQLLTGFEVARVPGEDELCEELKRLAGLDDSHEPRRRARER